MIKNVRVSYSHVFEPSAIVDGGAEKYSISALIPKNDIENLTLINDALTEAYQNGVQKHWKAKIPAIMKNPLRDGDAEKDLEKNPEYAGMMFIGANNDHKPMVIGRNREPLNDPSQFYSGCIANVLVNFFPFSKAGNNGVGCSLLGVQFVSEGEALASNVSINDFDEMDMNEDKAAFNNVPKSPFGTSPFSK